MQRKHERKTNRRRRRLRRRSNTERERERTKRAAEKDAARTASIADKAVAHFFQVSTAACEKTNGQRRTPPTVISKHLQRCSVCDPVKNKYFLTSKFSYFLSFFLSFFQPHQQNHNRLGLPIGERLLPHPNTTRAASTHTCLYNN
jgi:hypothetical protein